MYFIYFLYSDTSDRYYVGHSNDVKRRLKEHNTNTKMTYTHKFGQWKLMKYYQVKENRGDALRIERYIKKQKSRKIIERLINEPDFFGEIVQEVRVPIYRD